MRIEDQLLITAVLNSLCECLGGFPRLRPSRWSRSCSTMGKDASRSWRVTLSLIKGCGWTGAKVTVDQGFDLQGYLSRAERVPVVKKRLWCRCTSLLRSKPLLAQVPQDGMHVTDVSDVTAPGPRASLACCYCCNSWWSTIVASALRIGRYHIFAHSASRPGP